MVDFLVYLSTCRTLTTIQDPLIGLWRKLDPFDQRPQIFPRRMKEPPTGRFMASRTAKINVGKTKRRGLSVHDCRFYMCSSLV